MAIAARNLRLYQRQDHHRKAAGLTHGPMQTASAFPVVTPAQARIQGQAAAVVALGPRFRGGDGESIFRMTSFSPREIVSELDRYIVGQDDAKRAVAIALRNRWRRQQLRPNCAKRCCRRTS